MNMETNKLMQVMYKLKVKAAELPAGYPYPICGGYPPYPGGGGRG